MDGVYTFLTKTPQSACPQPPLCQGWSSAGGTDEWLIFDMGSCVTVGAVAIYASGDGQHDPKTMWLEIGDSASDLTVPGGNSRRVFNFTGNASTHYRQEWAFAPVASRYWKWTTSCRWSNEPCPGFQTYLAEIEWSVSLDPTPEEGPGGAWRHAHQLDGSPASVAAAAARLPVLSCVASFTARTEWDAFTEMEVMATAGEVATSLQQAVSAASPVAPAPQGQHGQRDTAPLKLVSVFPTPRELAVRDFENVPLRWAHSGPTDHFSAVVAPSEYFTWQLGLINPLMAAAASATAPAPGSDATDAPSRTPAALMMLNITGFSVSKLTPTGVGLSTDNITCFNLEGVGYDGVPFTQPMGLVSHVSSLWFGVQIPDAPPPMISLVVTLHFDGGYADSSVTVTLSKNSSAALLPAHGDRDPTRLARLRWLNSAKGLDYSPSSQCKIQQSTKPSHRSHCTLTTY